MAIAYDTITVVNAGNTGTDPYTFSHTCTGSNRGLIVVVGTGGGTPATVTGVTYNGVSMTQETTNLNNNRREYIFSLPNPASGSNTVSVDWSGSSPEMAIMAISYTGVDQTDMVEATNTTTMNSGTTVSISVTSVSANAWIAAYGVSREARTWTVDSPATERGVSGGSGAVDSHYADRTTTTAGSYTVSWSISGGNETGPMGGVAIKAAPSALVKTMNGVNWADIKSINGVT